MFNKLPFLFLSIILVLILSSCSKSLSNQTHSCWYLVENGHITGNPICNKTRAQMYETYGAQYFFVNIDEPRFCWKLESGLDTEIRKNVTQSKINSIYTPFAVQSTKIQCNSFCKWKVFYKSKNNVNGGYGPEYTRVETFIGPTAIDTCASLFPGRVVTVLNTLDTLYTATFVQEMD